jgi:hypothetical protein
LSVPEDHVDTDRNVVPPVLIPVPEDRAVTDRDVVPPVLIPVPEDRAVTDRDVVPPVSIPVPEDCADTDTPDASDGAEVTFEVCLTSETVVTAPPSWHNAHEVDVPLTWAAEFTITRGSDQAVITSEAVKAYVHVVTTVVVTESRDGYNADGENITVQSEATLSTVIVTRQGCTATDELDVNFRWSANARVVNTRVPAPAG